MRIDKRKIQARSVQRTDIVKSGIKRIRAGSGLGDTIYLQSIVRYFLEQGEKLEVCADFSAVFLPLLKKYPNQISISPFTRSNIQIIAHYTQRRGKYGTDQYQDMYIQAGIKEHVDQRIDWEVQNTDLEYRINKEAKGKKKVFVMLPRSPMDRKDGFGKELIPDWSLIDKILDRQDLFKIQVGVGEPLYKYKNIDMDLTGKTNVRDVMDLGAICDLFIGPCSFAIPLSESFMKKSLLVWSPKVHAAKEAFIRSVTPENVLHRNKKQYGGTSLFIYDNWDWSRIEKAVEEWVR